MFFNHQMEIDSENISQEGEQQSQQQPQEVAAPSTSCSKKEEKMSLDLKEKKERHWIHLNDPNKLDQILQRNAQIMKEVDDVLAHLIVGLKVIGAAISKWDENDEEKAQAILDKLKIITRPRIEVLAEEAAERATLEASMVVEGIPDSNN